MQSASRAQSHPHGCAARTSASLRYPMRIYNPDISCRCVAYSLETSHYVGGIYNTPSHLSVQVN